jgi:shikimate dehydrogenase
MTISGHTKVNAIIGAPVAHSLTPRLHNAAYQAAGLDGAFIMVAFPVDATHLGSAVVGLRSAQVNGLACTTPHKTAILPFLDDLAPEAHAIGAVNTVVRRDEKFVGHNTDWIGITDSIRTVSGELRGRRCAIFGAGGAAAAAAYGVTRMGAVATIFNRTLPRAEELAGRFNCSAGPLDHSINSLEAFDILINCTTVGMGEAQGRSPFDLRLIRKTHTVLETIYHPRQTALLAGAAVAGATIVSGLDMFWYQAKAQFELHTGFPFPFSLTPDLIFNNEE